MLLLIGTVKHFHNKNYKFNVYGKGASQKERFIKRSTNIWYLGKQHFLLSQVWVDIILY